MKTTACTAKCLNLDSLDLRIHRIMQKCPHAHTFCISLANIRKGWSILKILIIMGIMVQTIALTACDTSLDDVKNNINGNGGNLSSSSDECIANCISTSSSSADEIEYDSFTDARDGKTYKAVQIGNQWWMAENLNYAGSDGELGTCNRHSYHHEDTTVDCDTYGRIYSKEEMPIEACTKMLCLDGTNDCNTCVGGICPAGWHLPSKTEWEELITFAGGYEVAGGKLKAKDGWLWHGEDGNGTDDYGFSALSAGKSPESPPFYCPQPECPPCSPDPESGLLCVQCPIVACAPPRADGIFGEAGWWWSSTDIDADKAFSLHINSRDDKAFGRNYNKSYSMSVRCVKD
ncbi:MAG: fibrobacter succinogenes major paralogous domain-containing protein [Fibromonadaceae bacterium]|jgi:uncharacterized protein (TIGR02145 family)|nr:fibrobacter succinogenes major paralogous domain-containing protein [Fibromonadaceae bacterium]